jgi:hypothetical protein
MFQRQLVTNIEDASYKVTQLLAIHQDDMGFKGLLQDPSHDSAKLEERAVHANGCPWTGKTYLHESQEHFKSWQWSLRGNAWASMMVRSPQYTRSRQEHTHFMPHGWRGRLRLLRGLKCIMRIHSASVHYVLCRTTGSINHNIMSLTCCSLSS